ncbi:MAG: hypothetical protein ACTSSP_05675, partial [Candidatus Asgardarchaeia archaeon]
DKYLECSCRLKTILQVHTSNREIHQGWDRANNTPLPYKILPPIAIYIEDLVALLLKMTAEKKQKITDNDVSLLSYCMTVVFVECVLRTKESQMLEADFK